MSSLRSPLRRLSFVSGFSPCPPSGVGCSGFDELSITFSLIDRSGRHVHRIRGGAHRQPTRNYQLLRQFHYAPIQREHGSLFDNAQPLPGLQGSPRRHSFSTASETNRSYLCLSCSHQRRVTACHMAVTGGSKRGTSMICSSPKRSRTSD